MCLALLKCCILQCRMWWFLLSSNFAFLGGVGQKVFQWTKGGGYFFQNRGASFLDNVTDILMYLQHDIIDERGILTPVGGGGQKYFETHHYILRTNHYLSEGDSFSRGGQKKLDPRGPKYFLNGSTCGARIF